MITVYAANETNFTHNGLAVLTPTVCTVSERLNDAFELTLTHPEDGRGHWRHIAELNVIRAPTPRGYQLFRIYKVVKKLSASGTAISVNAMHIFYDGITDNLSVSAYGMTPDEAINRLYGACEVNPYLFTASSDMTGNVDLAFTDTNPVNALLDGENGLAAKLGGELWRDNFTVTLTAAIGADRGRQIRYRKDLTGLDFIVDTSSLATRVKPKATIETETEDGSEEETFLLPEVYIDSPYADNYPFPMVRVEEYGDIRVSSGVDDPFDDGDTGGDDDAYTEYEARDEMRRRVAALFASGIDLPDISAKVDFADLGDTEEYKEYKDLSTVSLGDTVTIVHEGIGVRVKAKVIQYAYDAVLARYQKLDIGKPRVDFARKVSASLSTEKTERIAGDMGSSRAARKALAYAKAVGRQVDGVSQQVDDMSSLGRLAASVNTFADLPGNSASFDVITINDFADVQADETHNGDTTRYIVSAIGSGGAITWKYDITYSYNAAGKQNVIRLGTCATAAAAAAKAVSIPGYTLTKGDLFFITYTSGNTAASATININGAGAKAVRLGGGAPAAASGTGAHYIAAGYAAMYYYNGSYMWLLGSTDVTDANSTYALITQAEINTGTSTAARLISPALLAQNIKSGAKGLKSVQRGARRLNANANTAIAISSVVPSKCLVSIRGQWGGEDEPYIVSLTATVLTISNSNVSSGVPIISWEVAEFD